MLLGERNVQAVVGCRGLQLQIERAAEPLAQGQPPGTVDARPEGGMDYQLHPARFVEKPFCDDLPGRRQHAQKTFAGAHVSDCRFRAPAVEAAFGGQEFASRVVAGSGNVLADIRHGLRKLGRSPRRLAAPEGDRRRRALRVFDADLTPLHAPDPPRRGAQQKHVAAHRLDGEVLIEQPDDLALGLDHDLKLRVVGNRPARGNRRHARVSSRPQATVYAVPVQIRAAAAARRGDAFGEHGDNRIEARARQPAVGISPLHPVVKLALAAPFLALAGAQFRDQLLRQDIQRRLRDLQPIENAAADGADQRRQLDRLVARRGEEPPLRRRADPVP